MTNRVNVHKSIIKDEVIIPFTEPSSDPTVHRRGAEIRVPKDITEAEILLILEKTGWRKVLAKHIAGEQVRKDLDAVGIKEEEPS